MSCVASFKLNNGIMYNGTAGSDAAAMVALLTKSAVASLSFVAVTSKVVGVSVSIDSTSDEWIVSSVIS